MVRGRAVAEALPRSWKGTILGEAVSKANSRRVVKHGATLRVIKSQKAINYVKWAHEQLRGQHCHPLLEGDLRFTATLFYASRRPDLDASVCLDVLQGLVYANDRQVKEIHLFHAIDKQTPRAEIVVETL